MSNKSKSENDDENQRQLLLKTHFDWSMKQSRILTAAGKALEYYKTDSFTQDELPHYYLLIRPSNETHHQFRLWKNEQTKQHQQNNGVDHNNIKIVGAWHRTIFVGGWEYSSDQEEDVFNLQSNNLFIDMRIPKSRDVLLKHCSSWDDCSDEDLRICACQHVFSGFTCCNNNNSSSKSLSINFEDNQHDRQWLLCTRHHCLDWNLIRTPRPRPNKWYVQIRPGDDDQTDVNSNSSNTRPIVVNQWKEWAFATDPHGQHYYMEQWDRIPSSLDDIGNKTRPSSTSYVLALRKVASDSGTDGVLILVDGYFSYILGRQFPDGDKNVSTTNLPSNLVDLVDDALQRGDRALAMTYLQRIEAGHGKIITKQDDNNGGISMQWMIQVAIPPWKKGNVLMEAGDFRIEGNSVFDCRVYWKQDEWELYDHRGVSNLQELRDLLGASRLEHVEIT